MDQKKPAEDNTNDIINEKVNTDLPSPKETDTVHGEARRDSRADREGQSTSLPCSPDTSEKKGSSGFLLFFSLLISLASLLLAGYLFTDSVRVKNQLKTAELEADFLNKRSEMFANEISQWKNDVLKNMDGLDKRLAETESFLEKDRKARWDIELSKLLMGINELSRFSDYSARARIEEAAIILQSITTSDTKRSLLEHTPGAEKRTLVPAEAEQPVQTDLTEESITPVLDEKVSVELLPEEEEAVNTLEKKDTEPDAGEDENPDM